MSSDSVLRVLLVEDNPDTQVLLEYLLRPDFYIELVAHVDEALAAAKQGTYDVLLLDINLGEQRTGVDLLHALRALPSYSRTPAIALTAYAMPGDRERLLEAGFDDYISKPFTREDLTQALRLAVERDDTADS